MCDYWSQLDPSFLSINTQEKLLTMSTTPTTSQDNKGTTTMTTTDGCSSIPGIRFVDYVDESQLEFVTDLVGRDLSEPYSSK